MNANAAEVIRALRRCRRGAPSCARTDRRSGASRRGSHDTQWKPGWPPGRV